jgi:hypothetical protein
MGATEYETGFRKTGLADLQSDPSLRISKETEATVET